MKAAMRKYFDSLLEVWKRTDDSLPMTVRLDGAQPFIYVGRENEEGWIQWKPVEKEMQYDLTEIERGLDVKLHDSIKQYYNSYWFCTLGGLYESHRVSLDPVVPDLTLTELMGKLKNYKDAHNGKLQKIPIGLEGGSDLLLVVDNETGEVLIEDHDRRTFEVLAHSLADLIGGLSV